MKTWRGLTRHLKRRSRRCGDKMYIDKMWNCGSSPGEKEKDAVFMVSQKCH